MMSPLPVPTSCVSTSNTVKTAGDKPISSVSESSTASRFLKSVDSSSALVRIKKNKYIVV